MMPGLGGLQNSVGDERHLTSTSSCDGTKSEAESLMEKLGSKSRITW